MLFYSVFLSFYNLIKNFNCIYHFLLYFKPYIQFYNVTLLINFITVFKMFFTEKQMSV